MNYEVASLVASLIAAVALPLAGVLAMKLHKRNADDAVREEAHTSLLACNADLKAQLRSADEYAAKLLRELIPLREKQIASRQSALRASQASAAKRKAKSNGATAAH